MRLLVLTTSYPSRQAPFNGVFVRDHALAMAAAGHAVRVMVPHVFAQDPAREQDGPLAIVRVPYRSDGRLLSDRTGVPVMRIATLLASWVRLARREGAEWRPDVVHAHWAIPSGIPGKAAARQAGAPLVVTVHRADADIALRRPASAGRLMRSVLRAADRVIAVSDALAGDLERSLGADPARIEVLPMGVDTTLFSPGSRAEARDSSGLPPNAAIVLGVGALIERKRFADVLHALVAVRSALPRDVVLVLAGDGPERAALEALAGRLGVAESVRFLGATRHEDLPGLVRAADVLVLASESEGLPVVLMEAAAAGTPSVATDAGGSVEAVGLHPLGRLVPVGDVDGLASAIGGVLAESQPDVRPTALPAGSRYSLAGAAGRMEAIYQDLAERRR